jgi:chemotaxis protein histidine kinase CheA
VVATSSTLDNQGGLSVRIGLDKLDEVVNLFGELLMHRGALDDRMNHLMQIMAREDLNPEIKTIVQECKQIYQRQTQLSSTLQDQLLKMRLVSLSTMTPRLYRAALAVAIKLHKEFDFLLEGETTEVDRAVFEEIAGPLLHLMRNAVTHGIEMPEARTAAGKSRVG